MRSHCPRLPSFAAMVALVSSLAANVGCSGSNRKPAVSEAPSEDADATPEWPEVICTTFELDEPVASFDPNADIVLVGEGGTRPDEYHLTQVFGCQHDLLDRCVDAEKTPRQETLVAETTNTETSEQGLEGTRGETSDTTLHGEVEVAVLLNPLGNQPHGVNVLLPPAVRESAELTECVRRVAASAPYPAYNGPPFVVVFVFELDPGFDEQ